MDDCTQGDKPAGWRGQLTVRFPISSWEYRQYVEMLSREAVDVKRRVSECLRLTMSDDDYYSRRGYYRDYVHDNALVVALEADGYTVTIQDDTTDKEDE